jgi:DNA modification methylase
MIENRILPGNSLDILKTLPDQSVDCCVTSPPYYLMRDYGGIEGQIGLEDSPEKYLDNLLLVFREVFRLLKDTGTLWIIIGDTYAGSRKGDQGKSEYQILNNVIPKNVFFSKNIKPKSLIGIPWRLAIAMQQEGWILRQDIIWHKPSPMPESVRDRFCRSHEYIFLFVKQQRYYFNISEALEPAAKAIFAGHRNYATKEDKTGLRPQNHGGGSVPRPFAKKGNADRNDTGNLYTDTGYRLKRDVWNIAAERSSEAHYAMFPEKLIIPCIRCGCPDGGIVLDPFAGTGTTAVVAMKHFRKYLGIEINPEYIKIAEKRIAREKGLFNIGEVL